MKKSIIFSAMSLAVLGHAASAFATPVDVDFVNKSKWSIEQIFLSPTKENKWGPDQLEDKVLKTGESFKLKGVPVGKYDAKIVDEDEDECVVANLKFADHSSVTITDENLLDCQDKTEAAADEDDQE